MTRDYCSIPNPVLIVLEYLPYGGLLGYRPKSRGIVDTSNTGVKGPSSALSKEPGTSCHLRG